MIARLALALLLAAPAAGLEAGGELQVNSSGAGDQGYPSVCAHADGSATVVWESRQASGSALRGRRFDAAGAPLGGELALSGDDAERQAPAVACAADGGYVLVWEQRGGDADDFDIGARRVAADGSLGPPLIVNATTAGRQRAAAVCALPDGGAAVAWQGDEPDADGGYGIFLQRLAADGGRRGDELRLNQLATGEQQHPALACAADGGVAVLWESRGQDGDGGAIVARRVAADGSAGDERMVNATAAGDQRLPAIVALPDGGFLAAWESEGQDGDESAVVARRLADDLAPLGAEVVVNACAAFSQEQPALAIAGDGVVVAWSSPGDGDGYGIFARRLDAGGAPREPEVLLNVATAGHQGALSDEGGGLAAAGDRRGALLVAWQSRRLQGAAPDGDGAGVFARRLVLPATACAGDCDGDGAVAIDELVRGVALALADGSAAASCAALDADGDDRVVVAELIAAVAAALAGCP